MTVLHIDLDNTLIYSYKHDIGNDVINVEIYQDREVSFLTKYTYDNLNKIKDRLLIVPTSTRSIEQYERIDLKIGKLPYALACNGGVLLINGERNEAWYQTSLELIRESLPTLHTARRFLEKDGRRKFELRFIEELFLFTKCREPETIVAELKKIVDLDMADVFCNGEKVYVVPNKLSKGVAVERFREYSRADRVIAAGDSEFDISMLRAADIGIAPQGFQREYALDFQVEEMPGDRLYSDELSDKIANLLRIA
ncbi:MAG: HAD hydrolase family protein [Candidatus Gastranaerophilales bacterium]|nr:HAD hydrolase family protein [Candidatus Gastranaerophilales bacterium]